MTRIWTTNQTWQLPYRKSHLVFECWFKARSSKLEVSFHWNVAKETFELGALSFRKCHPKWDCLYLPKKSPLATWGQVSFLLVSWSVIWCQDGCSTAFAKGALPEECLSHNFEEQYLWGHWDYLMLFLPSWVGTIHAWALRFLVVREINCGDWLARGCMPAHQHCDLFYPIGWGSVWVYRELGNAPLLRSGTGSWVLSG